jgi:hypothetical protein
MAALLPTNSPAPMIPPMEIMAMWRGCSERLNSDDIIDLWGDGRYYWRIKPRTADSPWS